MTSRSRASRLDALIEAFRRRPALLPLISSIGLGGALLAALDQEVQQ